MSYVKLLHRIRVCAGLSAGVERLVSNDYVKDVYVLYNCSIYVDIL